MGLTSCYEFVWQLTLFISSSTAMLERATRYRCGTNCVKICLTSNPLPLSPPSSDCGRMQTYSGPVLRLVGETVTLTLTVPKSLNVTWVIVQMWLFSFFVLCKISNWYAKKNKQPCNLPSSYCRPHGPWPDILLHSVVKYTNLLLMNKIPLRFIL
jgi:hypothetical protein